MAHLTEQEERVFRNCVRDILAGGHKGDFSYRRQWLRMRWRRGVNAALWGLAVGGLAAAAMMACMTPGGARFIANLPRRAAEAGS